MVYPFFFRKRYHAPAQITAAAVIQTIGLTEPDSAAAGAAPGVGIGVAVGAGLGVAVAVGAGVAVGVGVAVGAGVAVAVGAGVAVGLGVAVGFGVEAVCAPLSELTELLPVVVVPLTTVVPPEFTGAGEIGVVRLAVALGAAVTVGAVVAAGAGAATGSGT